MVVSIDRSGSIHCCNSGLTSPEEIDKLQRVAERAVVFRLYNIFIEYLSAGSIGRQCRRHAPEGQIDRILDSGKGCGKPIDKSYQTRYNDRIINN